MDEDEIIFSYDKTMEDTFFSITIKENITLIERPESGHVAVIVRDNQPSYGSIGLDDEAAYRLELALRRRRMLKPFRDMIDEEE